jgi:hypothetical protein
MLQDNANSSKATTGQSGRPRNVFVLILGVTACLVTAVVIFFAVRHSTLSPEVSPELKDGANPAGFRATATDVPGEAGELLSQQTPKKPAERPGAPGRDSRGGPAAYRPADPGPMSNDILAMETLGPQQEISWDEFDNPALDGWATEEFQAQAGKQLNALAKLMFDSRIAMDAAALNDFVTHDFSCQPLLPENLKTVFADQVVTVQREGRASDSKSDAKLHRQVQGFATALTELISALGDVSDLRIKFKVVSVQAEKNLVTTQQLVELAAGTSDAMIEQHATWTIQWVAANQAPPRIRAIAVERFEQTRSTNLAGSLYTDCTASVVGANACYQPQFLRGMNHWLRRIQSRNPLPHGHTGLAIGDVNGDGLDDLYVCQESGLPNRLFVQLPDGSAKDVSAAWGVDWLDETRSALLVDLDNDGDQDLVLGTVGNIAIALNKGTHYEEQSYLPSSFDTTSLSAADYDNDGDLDLFVCAYYAGNLLAQIEPVRSTVSLPASFVLHDAVGGGANHLFRNELKPDGTLDFVDITAEVGMDTDNKRYCYAASWEDFDNDGDQDLYVANDFGRNHLFRNDVSAGGQFVDVATGSGALDQAQGMSVSWADFNRDGLMDLYVGNMFSSAGNRIVTQSQFKPDVDQETRDKYLYLARGNTLLQNRGSTAESAEPGFRDVSDSAAVTMGRWAWGTNFVDINNDGWEDLIVANGNITGRADENGQNSGDL